MNDTLIKDALERIGVTALLAAISTALVVTQDWDYYWVPILAVVLNTLKVFLAQQYGDPNTGGFTNVVADEMEVDAQFAPAGEGINFPEDEFIDLGELTMKSLRRNQLWLPTDWANRIRYHDPGTDGRGGTTWYDHPRRGREAEDATGIMTGSPTM